MQETALLICETGMLYKALSGAEKTTSQPHAFDSQHKCQ